MPCSALPSSRAGCQSDFTPDESIYLPLAHILDTQPPPGSTPIFARDFYIYCTFAYIFFSSSILSTFTST
ncbi:hypothetical protein L210DRAFT_955516 [Boletus edulis BED1]|uniref:Uncharacterized protein n=1 Tax=Boletus edulis BED1 TaxID=1328754 RepID=A0AAD4BHZ8_BOLED|nr:hypothetical protein L210DRAFT_955516 [Boletus edulis BED1]